MSRKGGKKGRFLTKKGPFSRFLATFRENDEKRHFLAKKGTFGTFRENHVYLHTNEPFAKVRNAMRS